jgi:serine/threonine protein kinase
VSLHPGARLGPYEILSAIGAGGMGEVYRARDTRLSRVVAIKVLLSGAAQSAESRERFEREARLIARLNLRTFARCTTWGEKEITNTW